MKNLERILKALANKRRLEILKTLKKDIELSVGDITSSINLSFKATSRHLSILTHADILEKEQRGLQVFYSISSKQSHVTNNILSAL